MLAQSRGLTYWTAGARSPLDCFFIDEDGEIERIILSKWGEDGEYFHKIKDLPEALQFDDWEIWTERRDDP